MEEKERFSIGIINGILYLYDNFNKSNTEITLKDLSDLLNQQDKRIKELETELENYKLCRCVDCSNEYEHGLETSISELEKENQQLKSRLAKIVYKIKERLYSKAISPTGTSVNCVRLYDIKQILDAILKEISKVN